MDEIARFDCGQWKTGASDWRAAEASTAVLEAPTSFAHTFPRRIQGGKAGQKVKREGEKASEREALARRERELVSPVYPAAG